MDKALRYNNGKNMLSLVPTELIEGVGKVLSYGASKYTVKNEQGEIVVDGRNNWRSGLSWTSVIDSLERHLLAFKKGELVDMESGLEHLSHAATNIAFLLNYQHSHPELDDRVMWYKKPFKRLFLDLDGVCCEFEKHFLQYLGLPEYDPIDWSDYRFIENLEKIRNDDTFWLSCPPLINPAEIAYPVSGYCTARGCSLDIIHQWLAKNNFPKAKVINVDFGGNKVQALKDNNCDIMIDDSINNFVDLSSNGVLCYLYSRPHNAKYQVGHLRIDSIKDLLNKL